MAAALRSAARKICGHAFERPQALLRTAASAAIKEERGRLLPGISHGRSSLRQFTSSESPSVLNNKNKGCRYFSQRGMNGLMKHKASSNHLVIRWLSREQSLKSRSCSLLSASEDKPPTYFVASRFICLAMMSVYILTLCHVSIPYYKSTMNVVEDK
ncbi:hypothetical protein CFC21_046417 [Triticum aestivum]|uniref:Uncharacterized protein n=3 Tax=Triticinae TaxID=1648030 RepID=A0A453EAR6_AEGTS|nr:uncharacterized protein LOC109786740 [Aegilops tauschii subsp. strangulata]XP_044353039.1 uncharacterized protein LOC123074208 [Triticum aestivum]KAF7035574.1 hypothetical protein CFC21_046417 [Triticum aestivum]